MEFLTYAGLSVPKRLSPSFEKVRAAVERDDLRSADVKKLVGHDCHRAKLDYDSRLLPGRLERLAGSQGEFFALAAIMALFHDAYGRVGIRRGAFAATILDDASLAAFPRSVLPEERRRRTYWNGVLARAEIDSTYRPARKLWRRERTGHYVPSKAASFRSIDDRGNESMRSIYDALRIRLLDDHAAALLGRAPRRAATR